VLATTAVPDLVHGPGEVIIAVTVADVLLLDAIILTGQLARAAGARVIAAARGKAKGKTLLTVA
jgi:NADPH:quinone reductase-like Zn-dependent oxidoreductase